MEVPNYLAKVLGAYRRGAFRPGRVTIVHVYHDDWCAIFRGGPCNCDPEIRLTEWREEEDGT